MLSHCLHYFQVACLDRVEVRFLESNCAVGFFFIHCLNECCLTWFMFPFCWAGSTLILLMWVTWGLVLALLFLTETCADLLLTFVVCPAFAPVHESQEVVCVPLSLLVFFFSVSSTSSLLIDGLSGVSLGWVWMGGGARGLFARWEEVTLCTLVGSSSTSGKSSSWIKKKKIWY